MSHLFNLAFFQNLLLLIFMLIPSLNILFCVHICNECQKLPPTKTTIGQCLNFFWISRSVIYGLGRQLFVRVKYISFNHRHYTPNAALSLLPLNISNADYCLMRQADQGHLNAVSGNQVVWAIRNKTERNFSICIMKYIQRLRVPSQGIPRKTKRE